MARKFLVSLLALGSLAAPAVEPESASPLIANITSRQSCGPISKYYNPHPKDWAEANTNRWLRNWMQKHQKSIKDHSDSGGFASAFGQYAVGYPDLTCKDDGSINCQVNVCKSPINRLGKDMRPAYYVLESIEHLHAYFVGMQESFQMATLLGALQTDEWTTTFYKKKDGHDADDANDHGITVLKEIANALVTVFAAAAAFAAPPLIGAEFIVAGMVARSAAALFTGAYNAGAAATKASPDFANSNFHKAADVGAALAAVVQSSLQNLIQTNNAIMHGDSIDSNGTNIADFLASGAFLNASADEVSMMQGMNAQLQGMAINRLWRQNKIFIMGGGKCGDNDGIGQGPQNFSYCDPENKAWYLYFWQENDVISLTAHQWGWVTMPPGADQLGQGAYKNITVQNVIKSSLGSFRAAGYNYSNDVATNRTKDAIVKGWANPLDQGAGWEGIFTIPVCDVSSAIGADYQGKEYILQDYGHDSRPVWCGPICGGDLQTTKEFINATLMEGFKSPKHLCDDDPGYSSLD